MLACVSFLRMNVCQISLLGSHRMFIRTLRTYCSLGMFEHIKKISTSFLPQSALGKCFAKESVQGTAIKRKDYFQAKLLSVELASPPPAGLHVKLSLMRPSGSNHLISSLWSTHAHCKSCAKPCVPKVLCMNLPYFKVSFFCAPHCDTVKSKKGKFGSQTV